MVSITFPAPSDAAAIGTGKLTLRAGPRGWGRRGEIGPKRVGIGTQPLRASPAFGRVMLPISVSLKATADWHNDQVLNQSWVANWLPSWGLPSTEGAHLPLWSRHMREDMGPWPCPQDRLCGEGRGGTRPLRQAPGFRERPVKDDGLRHSTGTGRLWGRGRGVVGTRHIRDTYLCNPKRTV